MCLCIQERELHISKSLSIYSIFEYNVVQASKKLSPLCIIWHQSWHNSDCIEQKLNLKPPIKHLYKYNVLLIFFKYYSINVLWFFYIDPGKWSCNSHKNIFLDCTEMLTVILTSTIFSNQNGVYMTNNKHLVPIIKQNKKKNDFL